VRDGGDDVILLTVRDGQGEPLVRVCLGVLGRELVEDTQGLCSRRVRQAVFHGVRWRRWTIGRITKIDARIGEEALVIVLTVGILVDQFPPRLFGCLCPVLLVCGIGRLEFSKETCLQTGSDGRRASHRCSPLHSAIAGRSTSILSCAFRSSRVRASCHSPSSSSVWMWKKTSSPYSVSRGGMFWGSVRGARRRRRKRTRRKSSMWSR
jgi:hypothetical protein